METFEQGTSGIQTHVAHIPGSLRRVADCPGAGTGSKLNPPEDYPHKEKSIPLPLTAGETANKRKALLEYQTQMIVMGRYLLSFARANELFRFDN